ncbi:MAG: hypothetical protein PHF65_01720 [Oscillospiraceae bacterium]|jgi:hypothetical protein|nr:hypothetical protein [Oscillospiraceae bacterium]
MRVQNNGSMRFTTAKRKVFASISGAIADSAYIHAAPPTSF